MVHEKRKTVGSLSTDLLATAVSADTNVDEIGLAGTEDYLKHVIESAEEGFKTYTDDFYIVVLAKKERLMKNVIRNYFLTRKTCPTPNYDQTVFRVHYEKQEVSYLWTVPSRDMCFDMLSAPHEYKNTHQDLLRLVVEYASGNLLKWCKALNNEQEDSPLLCN